MLSGFVFFKEEIQESLSGSIVEVQLIKAIKLYKHNRWLWLYKQGCLFKIKCLTKRFFLNEACGWGQNKAG